jgi:hypothetical protein
MYPLVRDLGVAKKPDESSATLVCCMEKDMAKVDAVVRKLDPAQF